MLDRLFLRLICFNLTRGLKTQLNPTSQNLKKGAIKSVEILLTIVCFVAILISIGLRVLHLCKPISMTHKRTSSSYTQLGKVRKRSLRSALRIAGKILTRAGPLHPWTVATGNASASGITPLPLAL
jgi:hypothetical protein